MTPVSVIIPIYNQAPFLRAALDAVWFQDYAGPVEVVVVNDGSTDDTADVMAAFEADLTDARTSWASRYDEAADTVERVWHARYPRT
ncbi:MAG: glycosyltransferase family 2 protein, partial [Planctomycetes bacterium]|nr:glycosyltransferase family 2 protein [Planctomycetota bacterium]